MESSKEQKVHKIFEKISDRYDHMNSVISFQQHVGWRKDTMKKMNVKKGAIALDVCCGTADWTIALARAVGDEGKVVGLDFSSNMLKVGQQKLEELKIKNAELVQGNAMELPFDDNSFDYVTIGFGLRNVPDYLKVLKEIHRVLKKGGMAVCLDTSQPTMLGFRQFYFFYFKYVMPFFGKLLAKSYNEYRYLHDSAKDFPGMKELKELFQEAGFVDVNYTAHFGGVAASHFGHKK